MGPRHKSTFSKAVAVFGSVIIAVSAIGKVSGTILADRESLREKYHWPTKIPYPKENPYSEAKFNLGRMLFFDPILSGPQTRSCASCHNPKLAWADGQPRAISLTQDPLALRCPTLFSVAWIPKLGWTGHFPDLESVAMTPITAPKTMNLPETLLIERLSAIPGYVRAFKDAFQQAQIDRREIEQALATFERSIVPTRSPFDRWISGDRTAINKSAQR